jgi:pyruvate formate lyase activating enzyme
MNDSREELRDLAGFLASVSPDIPWHISRFHPTYRLIHVPPTPEEIIHRAREIGYEMGLKYVYTGNLPGDEGEKTWCHKCDGLLIDRTGFMVRENRIQNSLCPSCGASIPGVWK